jgi:hypothetical protein
MAEEEIAASLELVKQLSAIDSADKSDDTASILSNLAVHLRLSE